MIANDKVVEIVLFFLLFGGEGRKQNVLTFCRVTGGCIKNP